MARENNSEQPEETSANLSTDVREETPTAAPLPEEPDTEDVVGDAKDFVEDVDEVKEPSTDYEGLPDFIDTIADRDDEVGRVLADVTLGPTEEFKEAIKGAPIEEKREAYRALANARSGGTPKEDGTWDFADDFFRGFFLKNVRDIEQTVEKFSGFEIPDHYVQFEDDPDSGWQMAGEYAGLFTAGAFAAITLGLGSPLVVGGLATLAGKPLLRVGSDEEAPEFEYGGLVTLGATQVLGMEGEKPEEKSERMKEYEQMTTVQKYLTQLKAQAGDDAAGFLLFAGLGKALMFGARGAKVAAKLLKHRKDLNENIRNAWGLSSKEMEDRVTKIGAHKLLQKKETTLLRVKTKNGDAFIAYKQPKALEAEELRIVGKLPDEPPPIPAQALPKDIAKDVAGVSPLRVVLEMEKAIADVATKGDEALARFESLARVLEDNIPHKGEGDFSERILTRIVGRAEALANVKAIDNPKLIPQINKVIQRLDGVGDEIVGIRKRVGSKAGGELQGTQEWLQLKSDLNRLGVGLDDMKHLPQEYQDFLKRMYQLIADGKMSPRDVVLKIPTGSSKGFLQFLGRSTAHNLLGTRAILNTAIGNTTGATLKALKGTAFYGPVTAIRDQVAGFGHLLSLVKNKLVDHKQAMNDAWMFISGQGIETQSGRLMVEQSMPKGWLGKFGNAITGWRFGAIHSIDSMTQAVTANTNARQAIGWLTDYRLRNVQNVTKQAWEAKYAETLQDVYKGLSEGKDTKGILPVYFQIAEENAAKLAFRRDLSRKTFTPVAGEGLSRAASNIAKMSVARPEDGILKSAVKVGIRNYVIPFSPTFINMAERMLYAIPGATKNLGRFGAGDRRVVQGAVALGGSLYGMDQLMNLGLLEMSLPFSSKESSIKAYGFTNEGIPEGHVRIGNRTMPIDSVGEAGKAVLLAHHVHSLIRTFQEDNPDIASAGVGFLSAMTKTFTPVELVNGVADIYETLGDTTQGTSKKAQALFKKELSKAVENTLPVAKDVRNLVEMKLGKKLSGAEAVPQVTEKTKGLEAMYEALVLRVRNAYGVDGFIQRNYFGEPVYTVAPEDYMETQDGLWNGGLAYLLGGTGTATDEGAKFYNKLREIGVMKQGDEHTLATGQKVADPYVYTPLSRSVSVPIKVMIGGSMRAHKEAMRLPVHLYNNAKGLMGLQEDVWDRYLTTLEDDDREHWHVARRAKLKFEAGLKRAYNWKKGEDLKDIMSRIALWDVEKINSAPPILRKMYDRVQRSKIWGENVDMYVNPGLTAKEQQLNVAKRRAIVELNNEAKKLAKTAIVLHPDIQKSAKIDLRNSRRGEDVRR